MRRNRRNPRETLGKTRSPVIFQRLCITARSSYACSANWKAKKPRLSVKLLDLPFPILLQHTSSNGNLKLTQ